MVGFDIIRANFWVPSKAFRLKVFKGALHGREQGLSENFRFQGEAYLSHSGSIATWAVLKMVFSPSWHIKGIL